MEDFETYVKSNYNVQNAVACLINYSFNSRDVIDKKSKVPVINYTIVMKLTWFDREGKQIQVEKLIFVNDFLGKSCEKSCLTIAPTEATNKFRLAKREIISKLFHVRQQKIDDLKQEQSQLMKYLGAGQSDIIPDIMRPSVSIGREKANVNSQKKAFDM